MARTMPVAHRGSYGHVLDGAAPQLLPTTASWYLVYDYMSHDSLDQDLYGGPTESDITTSLL
jgi:hypothetical protein